MLAAGLLCQQILLLATSLMFYKRQRTQEGPKCQLCSKELEFHSSTTNLCEHLMNRHSGSYKGDGAKKDKQGTIQAFARPKTLHL